MTSPPCSLCHAPRASHDDAVCSFGWTPPAPLHVLTARISSRDPDRLDITRKSGGPSGWPFAPSQSLLSAAKSGRLTFDEYEPRYVEEMRQSWRTNRAAWDALLSRSRIVICCYCVVPSECHRSLLATLLGKCGARVEGEIGLTAALAEIDAALQAEPGKLTARTIVTAAHNAGAELCVVWTSLEARGTLPRGSYERAKRMGLRKAMAEMGPPRAGAVDGGEV